MTHDATVGVRYSCDLCGIKDREVQVQARGGENVVEWMENTCIIALANDHARLSPNCRPQTLTNLMIPVSGADKIGGVIKQ